VAAAGCCRPLAHNSTLLEYLRRFGSHSSSCWNAAWVYQVLLLCMWIGPSRKTLSLFYKRLDPMLAVSAWTKKTSETNHWYIQAKYFYLHYISRLVWWIILSNVWAMMERRFNICSRNSHKSVNPKSNKESSSVLKLIILWWRTRHSKLRSGKEKRLGGVLSSCWQLSRQA
jgi:hypothetical protein